jgi:hypothetical protein
MQTCRGSLSATLLQPLPTSVVADLDIHDRSARNLKLADHFMIGVRDTGVAVGPQPNLLLHVDMSVPGKSGSSSSRMVERNYPDLSDRRHWHRYRQPASRPLHVALRQRRHCCFCVSTRPWPPKPASPG